MGNRTLSTLWLRHQGRLVTSCTHIGGPLLSSKLCSSRGTFHFLSYPVSQRTWLLCAQMWREAWGWSLQHGTLTQAPQASPGVSCVYPRAQTCHALTRNAVSFHLLSPLRTAVLAYGPDPRAFHGCTPATGHLSSDQLREERHPRTGLGPGPRGAGETQGSVGFRSLESFRPGRLHGSP